MTPPLSSTSSVPRWQLWILLALFVLNYVVQIAPAYGVYGDITVNGCTLSYDTDCNPSPFTFETVEGADVGDSLRVVARIFSATVCQVERLIGQTFSQIWCIVAENIEGPLAAFLVLYMVVVGLQYVLGSAQFSLSDVASKAVKMLLVWLFATQADYALGIMFKFYMFVIKDGIAIVLTNATGGGTTSVDILHNLDELATQIFATNNFSSEGRIISAIGGIMAMITMPGGWFIGPALVAQGFMTFWVFARTIITYLVAILAVVLYLTLGPFMIAMALFKTTERMFTSWLSQLTSFALQPMIIFAYLMMIEAYMENLVDFVKVDDLTSQVGVAEDSLSTMFSGGGGASLDWPVFMTQQDCPDPALGCEFLSFDYNFTDGMGIFLDLIASMAAITLLNFATIKFLDMVPEVARQLTRGSARAVRLGGGTRHRSFSPGGDSLQAPGENLPQDIMDSMGRTNQNGVQVRDASGNIVTRDPTHQEIMQSGMQGAVQSVYGDFTPSSEASNLLSGTNNNFWASNWRS